MFDTEKFIIEVEKRPGLYDLKSKEYSNRDTKVKLWEEVATEMYQNWNDMPTNEKNTLGKELQTKWKSIRDQFKRDLNFERKLKIGEPAKKKKKYIFYDQLLFLRNFLECRPTSSNIEDEIHNEETDLVESEVDVIQNIQERDTPKSDIRSRKAKVPKNRDVNDFDSNNVAKEISNIFSESVALQRQERQDDIMGNKAFLMSLLPLMNQLTQDQSFYVRFKIMELLQQLRTSGYQPYSYSQPSTFIPPTNRSAFNVQPIQPSSTQSVFNIQSVNPHTIQSSSGRCYTVIPSALSPTDDRTTPATITSEDSESSLPFDLYHANDNNY